MKRTPKGAVASTVSSFPKLTPATQLPTLIPEYVHKDCVSDLRQMLREAESGDLIGITFTAMYKKRNYVVNAAGEAHRNPTFALGMVEILKDYLIQQVGK